MSEKDSTATPVADADSPRREAGDRRPALAMALVAVSAVGIWLASRGTWLTVRTADDKAGESVIDMVGATWAPETTALVLTMLAGVAATLILGSVGRRVVGVLAAIVAAGASWSPLQLLTSGADPQRALDLLTAGQASQRASDPVTVTDWATVADLQTHGLMPGLAIAAAALGVLGGVLLAVRPGGGAARRRAGAYETPEVRRSRVREDLKEEPTSGRVMWDALDAGVDPTDVDAGDLGDIDHDDVRDARHGRG
ncbi:TIGR02234 family membrane protein [Corynebacterium sp. 335C]